MRLSGAIAGLEDIHGIEDVKTNKTDVNVQYNTWCIQCIFVQYVLHTWDGAPLRWTRLDRPGVNLFRTRLSLSPSEVYMQTT